MTDMQAKVVLVVPPQLVKTVKTALEQFGHLDPTTKITLDENPVRSASVEGVQHLKGREEDVSSSILQDSKNVAASLPSHQPANNDRALKSDADGGRFVDPDTLEARQAPEAEPSDRFPRLDFDAGSGRYVKPSNVKDKQNKEVVHTDRFPHLEFDATSGQYVKPSGSREEDLNNSRQMRIPTTIPYVPDGSESDRASSTLHNHDLKSNLLRDLNLEHLSQSITLSHQSYVDGAAQETVRNPVHRALRDGLNLLPEDIITSCGLTRKSLVLSFPDSYSIYKPMLLLSSNAFSFPPWKTLISNHPEDSAIMQTLWESIATSLNVTHIAINSPIPLHTTSPSNGLDQPLNTHLNILRFPSNLKPIYGSFGPPPTTQAIASPTPSDFSASLWVSTIQNTIHQVWAPQYSMFSRGNMREKMRLLGLPTIGRNSDAGDTCAVDMYAGIGYFAFSYKMAGVKRVVGFEMNPWSVEGLRRGAEKNGWRVRVFDEADVKSGLGGVDKKRGDADFLVFQMDNTYAERVVAMLEKEGLDVPPIQHVNLGLLPASRDSWVAAVNILDKKEGGWIHVHENIGVKDIEAKTEEVRQTFETMAKRRQGEWMVDVDHMEKVKMYAPGVVHVVFDVHVRRTA